MEYRAVTMPVASPRLPGGAMAGKVAEHQKLSVRIKAYASRTHHDSITNTRNFCQDQGLNQHDSASWESGIEVQGHPEGSTFALRWRL